MVFKESAVRLLTISRMAGGEYVQKFMDPDQILSDLVPIALQIVHIKLREENFGDRFLTPLSSLARQVSDMLIVEYGCNDPAAVTAAVLADVPHSKETEQEIRLKLGEDTVKVWKEVKVLLDNKLCQVDTLSYKPSFTFPLGGVAQERWQLH